MTHFLNEDECQRGESAPILHFQGCGIDGMSAFAALATPTMTIVVIDQVRYPGII
jgi:hypothetical protein